MMDNNDDDHSPSLTTWLKLKKAFEYSEAQIRGRARRRGYQVMRVRGREEQRRAAAGLGTFMLLGKDRVVLFAATLEQIDEFLDRRFPDEGVGARPH